MPIGSVGASSFVRAGGAPADRPNRTYLGGSAANRAQHSVLQKQYSAPPCT
jgi:hypothetical protein